jgi:regulator of protease activity HflC (stomatin/prohibitin superfamily)
MALDPRLIRIRRYVRISYSFGIGFAIIGLAAIFPVMRSERVWIGFTAKLAPELAYIGAAFLLMVAGLLSAALTSTQRDFAGVEQPQRRPQRRILPKIWGQDLPKWLASGGRQIVAATSTWLPFVIPASCAALALAAVWSGWTGGSIFDPLENHYRRYFGGILLGIAFPVLVLERSFAMLEPEVLPEGVPVSRLLRVGLFAAVVLASESLLLSIGVEFVRGSAYIVAVLCALVATELLLRSLAALFLPVKPLMDRRAVADSAIAGLIRWQIPRASQFSLVVRNQFGIDLSRSWALSYLQRAFLPLLFAMSVFVWMLSGVSAIPISERGIYERLGRPAAVLHAGLHFHMPWPFGVIRRMEHGVIHELPIGGSALDETVGRSVLTPPPADGPAPESEDRLWTSYHASETTYLISNAVEDAQGFQVVSADLAVVYRIGLDDESAMRTAYNIAAPAVLIRAISGRLLAQHFARYTLVDVLGQNRSAMADQFRTELQAELDRARSGIEAIAVVVEAIHPPPGAAQAYHNVQASGILSLVSVAKAQAAASRASNTAQRTASESSAAATAVAAEILAKADAEATLFASERRAYDQGRAVFVAERWYEKLARNLAGRELTIVDHRLTGQDGPTIDFRRFTPGAAAYAAPATPSYTPPLPAPADDDHNE